MPQCAQCGHAFAVSEGFKCPSCGEDWRPKVRASQIPTARPAHMAVLDTIVPGSPEELEVRKRLVSTAGPAMPVKTESSDSVPETWMGRFQAARLMVNSLKDETFRQTVNKEGLEVPKHELTVGGRKHSPEDSARNLIQKLEAEDKQAQLATRQKIDALFNEDMGKGISTAELHLPPPPKKKRVSERIVIATIVIVSILVIWIGYWRASEEPVTAVDVDPALLQAAQKRKEALKHLEEGHHILLDERGDLKKAAKAYEKALALDPKLGSAERGIAIVYAKKGQNEASVKHYKRYLELEPNAPDAEEVRKMISNFEEKR